MNTLSPATIASTQERNQAALDDLRARFDRIGSVDVSRLDWRAMLETGALVNLKVSRYRGVKSLDAIDLGLDQSEVDQVNEILSLGHRLLLPATVLNEFNAIETRARQVVRQHTLLTQFGLFVTAGAWGKLASTVAPFKTRFESAVDALINDLDIHYGTMRNEYWRLAGQVETRLSRAGQYLEYDFQTKFVDRCMSNFPDQDTLRAKFAFNLSLSFVPLTYDQQTAQPNYAAASDDLLSLRQAVINEQTASRQTLVNEFLSSVQSEVFTLVNESMNDVLAAIENSNGNLAGRSSVQLRNLVERLTDLNFWSDPRLDLMKDQITAILDRAPAQRDQALTRATLDEIASRARQAVLSIERAQPINVSTPQPTVNLTLPERASRPVIAASTPRVANGNRPANRPF